MMNMDPKNKQLVEPDQDDDFFFDIDNVVSATECTGLTPAMPSEEEAEAYTQIYAIPRPKAESSDSKKDSAH